jgi:hypothetical protein
MKITSRMALRADVFIWRRLPSLVRSLKPAINAACATGAMKRAQRGISSGVDRGTLAPTISIAKLRSGSLSPVSRGTFQSNLGVPVIESVEKHPSI